jgi:hypothetical protein
VTSCAAINPTAEDAYWRRVFQDEPYFEAGRGYDDYGPAYRVGYTGPLRREGHFHEVEDDLRRDWDGVKGRSRLNWTQARLAVLAAWDRVTERAGEMD